MCLILISIQISDTAQAEHAAFDGVLPHVLRPRLVHPDMCTALTMGVSLI
jgi:hypothetical protein